MNSAQNIINEDPTTANHPGRVAWANQHSQDATVPFMWSIAMNSTIESEVEQDPSGGSVNDSDVPYIVDSALQNIIAACMAPLVTA